MSHLAKRFTVKIASWISIFTAWHLHVNQHVFVYYTVKTAVSSPETHSLLIFLLATYSWQTGHVLWHYPMVSLVPRQTLESSNHSPCSKYRSRRNNASQQAKIAQNSWRLVPSDFVSNLPETQFPPTCLRFGKDLPLFQAKQCASRRAEAIRKKAGGGVNQHAALLPCVSLWMNVEIRDVIAPARGHFLVTSTGFPCKILCDF